MSAAAAGATRHFPILTFHDLVDDGAVISTAPALFEQGMVRLHAAGFRTLDLAEVARRVGVGAPLPERQLAITFDDGYESVYHHALPVLARLGFTATIFVTAGSAEAGGDDLHLPPLEGRTLLTWGQVREWHRAGMAIGAHTLTHPDLTRIDGDRAEEEMVRSKQTLEDALGAPVTTFAYPFGRFDEHARALARRHFAGACSDALGYVTKASDPHTLERLDAYYLRRPGDYAKLANPGLRAYLAARNAARRLRGVLRGARGRRVRS